MLGSWVLAGNTAVYHIRQCKVYRFKHLFAIPYSTLKIFKFTGPVNIAPFLRFRFGNNCEIQSEIVLLWTGNSVFRRCFPPPSAWNSGNHRIRIKTEAKANCRRCLSGGKWLPTASITVRLCSRRVNTGGLGQ